MKSSASPQAVYYDKAKNVRAERFEGIVHLYRFDDITRINRGRAFFADPERLGDYILVDYLQQKSKRIAS